MPDCIPFYIYFSIQVCFYCIGNMFANWEMKLLPVRCFPDGTVLRVKIWSYCSAFSLDKIHNTTGNTAHTIFILFYFVNTRLPTFTVVHLIHTCLQWLEMYKCKIWIYDSIGVVAIDCQSSSSGQKIHSLRMTSWQLPWYHFWLGFSKL